MTQADLFSTIKTVDFDLMVAQLQMVKKDAIKFLELPIKVQNDKFFISKAIKLNPFVFKFIPDDIKNDSEFIYSLIKKDNKILLKIFQYLPEKFRDDFEFVSKNLTSTDILLNHVSDRLKNNQQIIHLSVKTNPFALYYVPENFKTKELTLLAVSANGNALEYAIEPMKDDVDVVRTAIKKTPQAIRHASTRLKDYFEIGMLAVSKNGSLLQYLSNNLRDNEELVLKAVKKTGEALKFASKRFKKDKETVLFAIKNDLSALQYASSSIQQLCKNSDPIKTLESSILIEKLQIEIPKKEETTKINKSKI